MICSIREIYDAVKAMPKRRLAVPWADDEDTLLACGAGVRKGYGGAVLIGDIDVIREKVRALSMDTVLFDYESAGNREEAAAAAVGMVRTGHAHILMKGNLHTSIVLKAVLDAERGLRTGSLLSDVFLFEQPRTRSPRLRCISDAGICIAPGIREKKSIIENAVHVLKILGNVDPKVAVCAALEVVNPAMPATTDAAELKKMWRQGIISGCTVDGPLSLDCAISPAAAKKKGVQSPVAGAADMLLMPDIEAGNMLAKSILYYTNAKTAHIVMGAAAPILIPSRSETDENKLNSMVCAMLFSKG